MAEDGRVDWRWRTGGDVIGRPMADDRHVYFVAPDNVLRAMNLVTGGQQWMRPLPLRPAWGATKAGADDRRRRTDAAAARIQPEGRRAGRHRWPPRVLPPTPKRPRRRTSLEHPLRHVPMLLMLFRDIAKGASATLVAHSLEPALVDRVAPLPNLVQIAPVTPTTPPPRP